MRGSALYKNGESLRKRVRNLRWKSGQATYQQWSSYPIYPESYSDSPFTTEEYPYQIIYWSEVIGSKNPFYHVTNYGQVGVYTLRSTGEYVRYSYAFDTNEWYLQREDENYGEGITRSGTDYDVEQTNHDIIDLLDSSIWKSKTTTPEQDGGTPTPPESRVKSARTYGSETTSYYQTWDEILPNTPVRTYDYPFQAIFEADTPTPGEYDYYLYVAKSDILFAGYNLDKLSSAGNGYRYKLVEGAWTEAFELLAGEEWDSYGYPIYQNSEVGGTPM